MNIQFKITSVLLKTIRADLNRPHPFAYERVGFILADLAKSANGVMVLAMQYKPVADEDYLTDRSVGAMMGPEAIRKAMEWALFKNVAIFHVHSHGGLGIPTFSKVDVKDNAKFIPDFVKVGPQNIHGAIVLSNDAAAGQYFTVQDHQAKNVDEFVEIGNLVKKWGHL